MSRSRRALRAAAFFFAALACLAAGLGGYLEWNARRVWHAPWPTLVPDRSPQGLARGEKIFDAKCAACHREEGAVRAAGRQMADLPPELGRFYAANLTRHPTAGIGGLTDAEIARAVRYGVTRDGRRSIMGWALSDADLAAVLGFLRSDHPAFEADATVQPRSAPSLAGKAVLAFVLGGPRPLPAQGIVAPPESSGAAYGEYLARQVYECADCHTPGFSPDKATGPDAFRGGMKLLGADGRPLYSRNLTFHSTGLLGWSEEDLGRALRHGLGRDGQPLRAPMPRFSRLEPGEVRALYLFLQSLPPRESGAPPRPPSPLALAAHPAEALFVARGCPACHAPGMPLEEKVVAARGKGAPALARWIRSAQSVKPGSSMPDYSSVLSEEQAALLAEWISAGRPAGPLTAQR